MKQFRNIATAVAILLLAACGGSKKAETNKDLNGEWQFVKMYADTDSMLFTTAKEFIRFDLEKKSLSGKASCNGFFGNFTSSGQQIKMGPIGSTMMACANLDTENRMKKGLETIDNWQVVGNKLYLKNGATTVFELDWKEKKSV